MAPVTLLWIASLLGAALFTGVGYFLALMRAERDLPAPETSPSTSPEPEPEPKPESHDSRPIPREDPSSSPDVAAAAEATAAAERALHRQLAELREELRLEVIARHDAEKNASALNARLVSCSQQVSALRAKLAAASGDDPRRTSPSLTPAPPLATDNRSGGHRLANLAPGLFGEIEDLRREVARLKAENESLRVEAFTKRAT